MGEGRGLGLGKSSLDVSEEESRPWVGKALCFKKADAKPAQEKRSNMAHRHYLEEHLGNPKMRL